MILAQVRTCRFCGLYFAVTDLDVAAEGASKGQAVHGPCVPDAIRQFLTNPATVTDTIAARGAIAVATPTRISTDTWVSSEA